MQIWLKSAYQFMRYETFWLNFGSLSPAVTLKIRSRSPKHNQLFIMSQCYIHANLVKIHHRFIRYRAYKKVSRQQDPHQKQYVPFPFEGGHNNC